MNFETLTPPVVLHWNYRGFNEFPLKQLNGEESEVTDLYLKENLITKLPADISKFKNLESLYLSGNDISELPTGISELKQLKCLDISGNRLTEIPDEIAEVSRLKFLILDENQLIELPLRLSELTSLQYLSVTDNKLKWLPQRPVYNYHHCELRFWRNHDLKTLPYSLWYHMFRNQETRSGNIGCLGLPNANDDNTYYRRCRLKLNQELNEYCNVNVSSKHLNILQNNSPPSLLELCRRTFYNLLLDTSKICTKISSDKQNHLLYDNNIENTTINGGYLEDTGVSDINGNICTQNDQFQKLNTDKRRKDKFRVFNPADILEEHFIFLPHFLKSELSNGPASRCENFKCKAPVFDYAFYEFCLARIILIGSSEQVILSAAFCSKKCAEEWKRIKNKNILQWSLV